ncbi:CBS domain-containing protein [Streptomyces sp. PA03-6a]|nr:CBS domain-containing protein [Streptomyces sp. PA03-6a]
MALTSLTSIRCLPDPAARIAARAALEHRPPARAKDIVVQCDAEGIDPATVQAGTLAGDLQWIDASAGADEALQLMEQHQIKRLPVIDTEQGHQLVGMISEADLARNLSDSQIVEFVTRVYVNA